MPDDHKIADPDMFFDMPEEHEALHNKCLRSLYHGLPMDDETDSRPMTINPDGLKEFQSWYREHMHRINRIEDIHQKNIEAGILGKMKEYAIRFAGMLHLADKAYEGKTFLHEEFIETSTMIRAVKLAEYFLNSAKDVAQRVNTTVIASAEVLRYAAYSKAGYPMQRIGDLEFPKKSESARRQAASRLLKKYIQEYPDVFGAKLKS